MDDLHKQVFTNSNCNVFYFFVDENNKSLIEQGHHSHFLCNPSRDTRADVLEEEQFWWDWGLRFP